MEPLITGGELPGELPGEVDLNSSLEADEDVDWLECISAIETHRGVLYFCDSAYFLKYTNDIESCEVAGSSPGSSLIPQTGSAQNKAKKRADRRVSRSIPSFISSFPHGVTLYSITAYNPLNMQLAPIDNHFSNQELLKDLREVFPVSEILKNFSYFPKKPDHFERGFTIMVPLGHPTNQEATVHRLATKYRQAAYFMCEIQENGEHRQKLVLLLGEKPEVVEESLVVIERLSYHPAYLHRKNNSVFHRFEDAMDILSKCAKFQETQDLFEIAKHNVKRGLSNEALEPTRVHPVIAVEGISDAGISKQSSRLSRSLGAQCLQSPPKCIQHLRKTFDKQNDLIRAAFYSIGNYILSAQMEQMSQKAPVIVDRYWNSTAAFTIVSEVGNGSSNLPPKDHFVYQWPDDLRKPDTVVLIGSRRELRGQRRRGKTAGCEKNRQIHQMLLETFRRMKMPTWIEVDRCKDKCWSSDAITAITIDKLQARNHLNVFPQDSSAAGICPGAGLHPSVVEHDILPVVNYEISGIGNADDDDGIPF